MRLHVLDGAGQVGGEAQAALADVALEEPIEVQLSRWSGLPSFIICTLLASMSTQMTSSAGLGEAGSFTRPTYPVSYYCDVHPLSEVGG